LKRHREPGAVPRVGGGAHHHTDMNSFVKQRMGTRARKRKRKDK